MSRPDTASINIDPDPLRKCLSSECSLCRDNCPSYRAFQLDSYSSRGKNRVLKAFLDGEVDIDAVREVVYSCTRCSQCAEVCLTGGDVFQQIRNIRSQLTEMSQGLPGHREMVDYIREKGTPYGTRDGSWLDGDPDAGPIGNRAVGGKGSVSQHAKGKIAYFPGCTIQAEHPEFARKTLRLLERFGVHAIHLTDQCCGSPVLEAGFTEDAREMAGDLMKEVRERKIKTIITSCTGCTVMLRREYPELTGKKVEVQHISEFLAKHRKKLEREVKQKRIVTSDRDGKEMGGSGGPGEEIYYHDPCDLARKLGVTEEPREVLRIMGYQSMEFENSGMETTCCGGGAGFARDYSDGASVSADHRIHEARELGAQKIVTACLSCRRMLKKAAKGEMDVVDLIELFDV